MARASRILHDYSEEFARQARLGPEDGLIYAIGEYYIAIKAAMEEQGVTRAELARRAQLKPSYVSRVLNNPENITLRTAFRLCHALDLQLGFEMKPYPDPLYKPSEEAKPKGKPRAKAPAAAAKPRKAAVI